MQNSSIFSRAWFRVLTIWAVSFGCIVGWGAFVMPGTTFLPIAGTAGTVIAMAIGTALIMVIAANFHNLMMHSTSTGGVFAYTKEVFGYDHSLMCVWSIFLAYISILWANSTAVTLISRFLFGNIFQWGFHYTVAGYDVWCGEIVVTISVLVLFGVLSAWSHFATRILQTSLAVILFVGVTVCFVLAFAKTGFSWRCFRPAFASVDANGKPMPHVLQILNIVALAPWAFIGFCVVSLLPGKSEFSDGSFPRKKSFAIMAAAIFCGMIVYLLLTLMATLSLPEGCDTWQDYIGNLSSYSALEGIPTFNAAQNLLGKGGVAAMGVCVVAAILTGILGMYRAAARLLRSMAEDDVLPHWFGRVSGNGLPVNATVFIMLISLVIPFFGRTAIGWIVDVTTISAAIAYAYVSAGSLVIARRGGNTKFIVCGVLGLLSATFFFFPLVPNPWAVNSLATESYLILVIWGMVGLVIFRVVFQRDTKNRFGKSTIMWIAMLFIVLISSSMWMRQVTHDETEEIVTNISEFHGMTIKEQNIPLTDLQLEREHDYIEEQMDIVRRSQYVNSLFQFLVIIASLFIMLNIFSSQRKREKLLNDEKILAQEASHAKSVFLSNMSHDIRTPMNAIIGYINLAKRPDTTLKEMREFLGKVEGSSQHLLALINDVLEMSRIESGKMDLEEVPCNLKKVMDGIRDMFSTQMEQKNITYIVSAEGLRTPCVLCDKNRLNRVLLNLVSNAFKFTPKGGTVYVSLEQKSVSDGGSGEANFELRVKDSGIGMSEEFAAKVFEAFERERTSTVSGIQGTGLGMAITKSIVDLMHGNIRVVTAPGEGTEFVVNLSFRVAEEKEKSVRNEADSDDDSVSDGTSPENGSAPDFSRMTLLLVDDVDVNREIAKMLLEDMGFSVETAVNGAEAVQKVETADAVHFDAVLMDIQMPVMDGYEATRAIRALSDEKKSSVPVIAMTANAFSEDVKKAHDAGMNAHVAKPIDIGLLAQTLGEILNDKA